MTAVETAPLEPGTNEWQRYVTASKIGGIFNASKYSSPTKEFHLLRGEIEPDPPNEAIERGNDFEPVILARFFRRHPELEDLGPRTYTREDLAEWAAANPDSVARVRSTLELIGVEAKTDGHGDHQWGKPGTSEIPLGYYLQVQWQMHMSGMRRTWVVCLGPFYDDVEYIIDYDPGLGNHIEQVAHRFWLNAMDPDGIPPIVDGHIETYNAIRRAHPFIDRDPDLEDWEVSTDLAQEFEAALVDDALATERLNAARSTLLRVMGNARRAVLGKGRGKKAVVVATRRPVKNGVALYKMTKPIDWAAVEYDEQAA